MGAGLAIGGIWVEGGVEAKLGDGCEPRGSGWTPLGMFSLSAKTVILRARPVASKSERMRTVSRASAAGAGALPPLGEGADDVLVAFVEIGDRLACASVPAGHG